MILYVLLLGHPLWVIPPKSAVGLRLMRIKVRLDRVRPLVDVSLGGRREVGAVVAGGVKRRAALVLGGKEIGLRMRAHHPIVVAVVVNAIVPPEQVRIEVRGPCLPVRRLVYGRLDRPLALGHAAAGVEVAEVSLATLLRGPMYVVNPGEVDSADAARPPGGIGVPGAVASRGAAPEGVEVGAGGASVVALLVGRQAEARGA